MNLFADLGSTVARTELGRRLLYADAFQANPERGLALLRHSAEADNDVGAMYIIGKAYGNGEVIPRNPVEARRWLTAADRAGSSGARHLLDNLG